jgi:biopolymer transport protein ExbD
MGASVGSRGPISDINVTPLVDVVLVLLIIFMVVTTFDEEDQTAGIAIELPGASTGQPLNAPEPFTVAVAASGQLVLKGKPATEAEVVAAVRAELAKTADLEVVVGADKASRHERFVALLDLLRGEGISRFAIQTDNIDTSSGSDAGAGGAPSAEGAPRGG